MEIAHFVLVHMGSILRFGVVLTRAAEGDMAVSDVAIKVVEDTDSEGTDLTVMYAMSCCHGTDDGPETCALTEDIESSSACTECARV